MLTQYYEKQYEDYTHKQVILYDVTLFNPFGVIQLQITQLFEEIYNPYWLKHYLEPRMGSMHIDSRMDEGEVQWNTTKLLKR